MALKNEIFSTQSTLFTILDNNEVTEIGAMDRRVDQIGAQTAQNKSQLDDLGRLVDKNQARNEAGFVEINTSLVAINSEINDINRKLDNIDLDELADISTKLQDIETRLGFQEAVSKVLLDEVSLLKEKTSSGTRVFTNKTLYLKEMIHGSILSLQNTEDTDKWWVYGREYQVDYKVLAGHERWPDGRYRIYLTLPEMTTDSLPPGNYPPPVIGGSPVYFHIYTDKWYRYENFYAFIPAYDTVNSTDPELK